MNASAGAALAAPLCALLLCNAGAVAAAAEAPARVGPVPAPLVVEPFNSPCLRNVRLCFLRRALREGRLAAAAGAASEPA